MNSLSIYMKRLTANRKQFAFMVVLMCVALIMWARLILNETPRSAKAQSVTAPKVEAKGLVSLSALPAAFPVVRVELPDQSKRDLFALNLHEFNQIEVPKVIKSQNLPPEKSDEARRAELLAQLDSVKVQTVIVSEQNSSALMNGKLYRVGSEPVPGFTITKITEQSVFVKTAGLNEEIELRMYRN